MSGVRSINCNVLKHYYKKSYIFTIKNKFTSKINPTLLLSSCQGISCYKGCVSNFLIVSRTVIERKKLYF